MLLRRKRRYVLWIPIVLVIACAAAFVLAPWKIALERRIEAALEAEGIKNVSLSISSLGWHGATFKDISIGADTALTVKYVELRYRPQELRNGLLRGLTVTGLGLSVHQGKTGWSVAGLEDYVRDAPPSTPFAFPASNADIAAFPFGSLEIKDSTLDLLADGWRLNLPLTITFRKAPAGTIDYEGSGLTLHMGAMEIDTGDTALSLALDDAKKQWGGAWSVKGVDMKGGSFLPVLDGAGTISVTGDRIAARGQFTNRDKSYNVDFKLDESPTRPDGNVLTVTAASLPWKQGTLSVRDVKIPLNGTKPVRIMVNVDNVSVDELMQSLTGQRVTATGTVSGAIPVILGRDGSLGFADGSLQSAGPGRIVLPPDVIPGDNAQIQLVRQLLQDLHYTDLQVALGNGTGGKLAVTMTVQGNNPAVYNGRPVKLNVHLGGDVLDLVRQNVMLLTDPKQMLHQGKQ